MFKQGRIGGEEMAAVNVKATFKGEIKKIWEVVTSLVGEFLLWKLMGCVCRLIKMAIGLHKC